MRKFLYFLLVVALSIGFDQPSVAQLKPAKQVKKPVKKEATVYVTRTGSKYHEEYCSYLRQSSIPIKKSDAQSSGYTACSRCNP